MGKKLVSMGEIYYDIQFYLKEKETIASGIASNIEKGEDATILIEEYRKIKKILNSLMSVTVWIDADDSEDD